jgi:hypothetical protein
MKEYKAAAPATSAFGRIFSFLTDPFPLKMVHFFAYAILLFVAASVIFDSKNRLFYCFEKTTTPVSDLISDVLLILQVERFNDISAHHRN